MGQLKQMQAKPTQENSDHAQRAEVLVKEVKELKRELIGIKNGKAHQSGQVRNVNGISQGSNRKAHIVNSSDSGAEETTSR